MRMGRENDFLLAVMYAGAQQALSLVRSHFLRHRLPQPPFERSP